MTTVDGLTTEERRAVVSARMMTPLTLLLVVATIKAEARREGAAEMLDKQADGIDPGDHHCFKPWCPQCAVRKSQERQRDSLRARAARLRGDES